MASINLAMKSLLPAGPLRSPLKSGIAKADIICVIGNTDFDNHWKEKSPIFQGKIQSNHNLRTDISYTAFTGIALPDKFRETLKRNGFKVTKFCDFPDHYQFKNSDLDNIINNKKDTDHVITTEKDWVRLPDQYKDRSDFCFLPIHVEWEDDTKMVRTIMKKIKS